MKILYVSDLAGLGGGEVSLLNIMKEMKKKYSVVLLSRVNGKLVDEAVEQDIKVEVYDFKRNLFNSFFKFRNIIKKNGIDVVHSNELTTGIILGIFLQIINKKVVNVCTCHGQWYELSFIKKFFIKRVIKHIYCVSQSVEDNLHKQGIYNTSVSYLGIDLDKYHRDERKIEELKSNLGVDLLDRKIVITTIGRYQEIKGQLKGVKAIKKLYKYYPNIIYLLVGDNIYNSEKDKEYKNKVENFIKNNQMEKYVYILGERRDIPEIMGLSDYIMIPSDNESFGMVAIESLAADKIIISTPCDGVKEILDNNSLLISKTNDEDGLFLCLKELISCPKKREEVKEEIGDLKFKFSIVNTCNHYVEFYKKRKEDY